MACLLRGKGLVGALTGLGCVVMELGGIGSCIVMGKGNKKKGAKKMKETPVKLARVINLSNVGLGVPFSKEARNKLVEEAERMELPAFTSLVESERLLCFNENTFADLFTVGWHNESSFVDSFTVGPAYSDNNFHDVWCPSELGEPGREFSFDKPVFVDHASDAAYEILISELKSREEKRLKAEEQLMQLTITTDDKMPKKQSEKQKQEASSATCQRLQFKDLRGGVQSMSLAKFFNYGRCQNLICFNRAGYLKLYEEEDEMRSSNELGLAIHFWFDGRKWDEELEKHLVYVEKLGTQHSLLYRELEKGGESEDVQQIEPTQVEMFLGRCHQLKHTRRESKLSPYL